MLKRGWTEDQMNNTFRNPFTTRPATDRTTGDEFEPATAFYNEDGTHVIVNNQNNNVVQVSNNSQVKSGDWVPDSSIEDPYVPGVYEGPIEPEILFFE